jgi:hypothetical protein
MTFQIPELSGEAANLLEAVDELVENGIPRNTAEPVVEKVFKHLEMIDAAMKDFEASFPQLQQRVLAKVLFTAELINWSQGRELFTAVTIQQLFDYYRNGGK